MRRWTALLLSALPLLSLTGCGQPAETLPFAVTQEMLDQSVWAADNAVRIANAMRRAEKGEPTTLAVFGGSITEGAAASRQEDRYADRVAAWWRETFPASEVTLVNAGIGATNTAYGAHRVQDDVLSQQPDLVIFEFAANDSPDSQALLGTCECCLRRLLSDESGCGVLLFFMATEDGSSAEGAQKALGNFYELPMLSYKSAYYTADFWHAQTNDGVHPTSEGHGRAALLITAYLQSVFDRLDALGDTPPALPEQPLVPNGADYMDGRVLDLADCPVSEPGAFKRNQDIAYAQKNAYRGYTATKNGAAMTFTVDGCKTLFLLCQHGPGFGSAEIAVAGGTTVTVNASADWGQYMWATEQLVRNDTSGSVTVTVTPQLQENERFTVLALLVS